MKAPLVLLSALLPYAIAQDPATTAFVNVAATRGESSHNASAFIYGMPLNYNPNQIPDHYYSDIAIKYGRAGGGQLADPCRGWAFGFDEYQCRLNATIINYKQTRKFGAEFFILPHDIWGIDYRTEIPTHLLPGDNGDWTSYDDFLDQLIADLKVNDALPGLLWDLWNEPDQAGFWGRSTQQWVDMYIRTHKRIRSDPALNNVKIAGPCLSATPNLGNPWWTVWGAQVAGNQTSPDIYVWHTLGGGSASDPQIHEPIFSSFLSRYNLPRREVNINEYATRTEMTPSGYAWWISRLERYNYAGMLGLWNAPLYDNFANLLTKSPGDPQDESNTNYTTAAGYHVYKYYVQSMKGPRAMTTGTTSRQFDVFATIGTDNVRLLAGTRTNTGNWTVQVQGLTSVGYPSSGTLNARYYAFYGTNNIFDPVGEPPYLGTQSVPIVNGVANLNVYMPDRHTGWRIEFPVL